MRRRTPRETGIRGREAARRRGGSIRRTSDPPTRHSMLDGGICVAGVALVVLAWNLSRMNDVMTQVRDCQKEARRFAVAMRVVACRPATEMCARSRFLLLCATAFSRFYFRGGRDCSFEKHIQATGWDKSFCSRVFVSRSLLSDVHRPFYCHP